MTFGQIKLLGFAGIVVVLLTLTQCARQDAKKWHAAYNGLAYEARVMLDTVREVSSNPKLDWKNAHVQVRMLGDARDNWRNATTIQRQHIQALAAESERLKKLSADAQARARKAIAQREEAMRRLDQEALTPGERSDCARQMREAQDVLDSIWESGL
jgi:hypothetical protein